MDSFIQILELET